MLNVLYYAKRIKTTPAVVLTGDIGVPTELVVLYFSTLLCLLLLPHRIVVYAYPPVISQYSECRSVVGAAGIVSVVGIHVVSVVGISVASV